MPVGGTAIARALVRPRRCCGAIRSPRSTSRSSC
jgi:hypothetical protein